MGSGAAAETVDAGTQTIISYVNASTQIDNGSHQGMQTVDLTCDGLTNIMKLYEGDSDDEDDGSDEGFNSVAANRTDHRLMVTITMASSNLTGI